MRDFRQRVGLVHELAQLIRSKERVDHRTQCFGVDQINRREHFVVAHIHALPDGTGHASKPYAKLVGQLLTHRAHTTVGQVVNIVHFRLGVDQLNQVANNGDDVFFGQDLYRIANVQTQFLVQTVTTYVAQVVPLLGEEQFINYATCRLFVRSLCVAQLTVDVLHRLAFGIRLVLL